MKSSFFWIAICFVIFSGKTLYALDFADLQTKFFRAHWAPSYKDGVYRLECGGKNLVYSSPDFFWNGYLVVENRNLKVYKFEPEYDQDFFNRMMTPHPKENWLFQKDGFFMRAPSQGFDMFTITFKAQEKKNKSYFEITANENGAAYFNNAICSTPGKCDWRASTADKKHLSAAIFECNVTKID